MIHNILELQKYIYKDTYTRILNVIIMQMDILMFF